MIALDTNALVRVLVEDDRDQAKTVRKTITFAEKNSIQILILSEVLIGTVWVLESVYHSTKDEISEFLDTMIHTQLSHFLIMKQSEKQFITIKKKGILQIF